MKENEIIIDAVYDALKSAREEFGLRLETSLIEIEETFKRVLKRTVKKECADAKIEFEELEGKIEHCENIFSDNLELAISEALGQAEYEFENQVEYIGDEIEHEVLDADDYEDSATAVNE